jgi:hypothetical protein
MGYSHGTPGLRLLKFLMQGRGTRTIMEISRRQSDGRLLAQARPELDGLIVECAGRSARSKRPVRRIYLTARGWAACAALQPGWQPRRLSVDVLKQWFEELQREGDTWANHWDKENTVLREKLAVYEDMKRRGLIYPSPILRKTRKDAKNPAAMLQRDLKREAREYEKQAPARLEAQIHRGGGFSNPTPAGKIPSGPRVATPPRPAPKFPTSTLTGFRCRECDRDTSSHMVGCPREGQLEGSFAIGKPKTLAQDPLLIKQCKLLNLSER